LARVGQEIEASLRGALEPLTYVRAFYDVKGVRIWRG